MLIACNSDKFSLSLFLSLSLSFLSLSLSLSLLSLLSSLFSLSVVFGCVSGGECVRGSPCWEGMREVFAMLLALALASVLCYRLAGLLASLPSWFPGAEVACCPPLLLVLTTSTTPPKRACVRVGESGGL